MTLAQEQHSFETWKHRFEILKHRFEILKHRFEIWKHRFEIWRHRFEIRKSTGLRRRRRIDSYSTNFWFYFWYSL